MFIQLDEGIFSWKPSQLAEELFIQLDEGILSWNPFQLAEELFIQLYEGNCRNMTLQFLVVPPKISAGSIFSSVHQMNLVPSFVYPWL